MKADPVVHGLAKGLRIFAALNNHFDASALELSRETGIPRPTVHRILTTLMQEGYITTSLRQGRYRVTLQAQRLSQGYSEESWVTDIAGPALERLRRQIAWPSDIATYTRGAMVIRRTTNHVSPLSVVDERVGARISVLRSALGRAYLAFCPIPTQEAILDILVDPAFGDADLLADRPRVESMLQETYERGYAVREGGIVPRTFSLGVPICVGGAAAAAINVICFRTATSLADAIAQYLEPMREAVACVEQQLAQALPVQNVDSIGSSVDQPM